MRGPECGVFRVRVFTHSLTSFRCAHDDVEKPMTTRLGKMSMELHMRPTVSASNTDSPFSTPRHVQSFAGRDLDDSESEDGCQNEVSHLTQLGLKPSST